METVGCCHIGFVRLPFVLFDQHVFYFFTFLWEWNKDLFEIQSIYSGTYIN